MERLISPPETEAPPTIRPAQMADIDAVLALHSEAFADKFRGAFGATGVGRGAAALAAAWRRQGPAALRGMFVAELDGVVVGTTTVRTAEMGVDDGGASELAFQQALGPWGAMRSLFALSILDHSISRDEGFITDVAVLPQLRGRGIATALMARAEEEARGRGKTFLGLYVSAANTGARRLYQRIGFHEVFTRRSWLARLFYRQLAWVYMRKDLG